MGIGRGTRSNLTPTRVFKTSVPFPCLEVQKLARNSSVETRGSTAEGDTKAEKLSVKPHASEKITFNVCSEFVQYRMPGSVFGTEGHHLKLINDGDGQPLVFSIGTDQKLYVLSYVNGASGCTWQLFNITPPSEIATEQSKPVLAFDAANINGKLVIAAAQKLTGQYSTIFTTVLPLPRLTPDDKGNIEALQNLKWTKHANCIRGDDLTNTQKIEKEVTTILIRQNARKLGVSEDQQESLFSVIASTVASERVEGSNYLIDPAPRYATAPWKNIALPRQAEKVIQCAPAMPTRTRSGLYILSAGDQNDGKVTCTLQSEGASSDVILRELKGPKSITSSLNAEGFTDLLVSTEAGLAYFNHKDLYAPHQVLLPEVSFKKSFCYETPIDKGYSKIAIFALSMKGEVYYIEGSRDYTVKEPVPKITFLASGLAIRSGVKVLAGTFNAKTHVVEMVFTNATTGGPDEIIHMKRDPVNFVWTDSNIMVPSDKAKPEIVSVPAFMTTVNLDNGVGKSMPLACPLELSSASPVQVIVDGKSYTLGKVKQTIYTSASGAMNVIIPTGNGSFACNDIDICLGDLKNEKLQPQSYTPEIFSVNPSERVLRMMGNVNSRNDLINAKTSDGRSVFPNGIKADDETLDQTANLLSKVPAAQQGKLSEGDIVSPKDKEPGLQGGPSSESSVPSFLGDAIQFVKGMVKSVVKVVFTVVKKGLSFVLQIAGKVFRFLIDTTKAIVGGIVSFLENVIGLDLSALRDWWQLHFCKVEQAQKVLSKTIETSFIAGQKVLQANEQRILAKLDWVETKFEEVIGRPRPKPKPPSVSDKLTEILNNPIIKILLELSPLKWILEGVGEGMSDLGTDYHLPDLPAMASLQSLLIKFAKNGVQGAVGLIWRLFANLGELITNPEKAVDLVIDSLKEMFWASWEAMKSIITETLKFILALLRDLTTFVTDIWKLPPLTDIWYDYTGCKFSILNVLTYVLAQIMELLNPNDKSWFDGINPDEIKVPDEIPEELIFVSETEKPKQQVTMTNSMNPLERTPKLHMYPPLADTNYDAISQSTPETKADVTEATAPWKRKAVKIMNIIEVSARIFALWLQAVNVLDFGGGDGAFGGYKKGGPKEVGPQRGQIRHGTIDSISDIANNSNASDYGSDLGYDIDQVVKFQPSVSFFVKLIMVTSGISFGSKCLKLMFICQYDENDKKKSDFNSTIYSASGSIFSFLMGILVLGTTGGKYEVGVAAAVNAGLNASPLIATIITVIKDNEERDWGTWTNTVGSAVGAVAAVTILNREDPSFISQAVSLAGVIGFTGAGIATIVHDIIDICNDKP